MKTITLPKRDGAIERFKRQWADKLTEAQLYEVINRVGYSADDIAEINLVVTFKGGRVLELAA